MTINITLFSDEWFERKIDQEARARPDASEDAKLQARAIMVAGAFIAQAIDTAFAESKGMPPSTYTALVDLAAAAERIAEAMEGRNDGG